VTIDDRMKAAWEAMQRQRGTTGESQLPLQGGSGGDNSGGMEVRMAKLEAAMEYALAELGKLSGVPADVAVMKERLTHIPTRVEVRSDIETAIERSAARTQRTVAIVGGLVTIAIAAINYLPKLIH
jgi:hypothetical protein